MPELPEVEVVKRGLNEILKHQPVLEKIELLRKDLREVMPVRELKKLEGQKVLRIERRAKYLLLWTDRGALLSHLGMTGTWRVAPAGDERLHDHVYLHFSGGLRLAYRDPRRFGILDVVQEISTSKRFTHLGPEPLSAEFSGDRLWQSLRKKEVALKIALMDQTIVVGVGNIYASEALFAAQIKPQLKARSLSREKAELLVQEIRRILLESIEKGGSSISDFAQASGESGYFQKSFKVYDREGEPCWICQKPLRACVLGGRSTFWCTRCQK